MRSFSLAIRRALLRFRGDASGIAAVEFAYLAPLLMLLMFGTFEVTRAVVVHKRFQRATAMVGDLVAREQQLGSTPQEAADALNGIIWAAERVLLPYSSNRFQIGVTQLRAAPSDATDTKVEWAWAYNSMPITPCPQKRNMPAQNLVSAGNAAILVEAKYHYTPLLTNIIPGVVKEMDWSDAMVFSPRFGSVFYGQATQNTICPA